MLQQKIERDDDSKKSHPALELQNEQGKNRRETDVPNSPAP
jgi:hypothetical protein